MSKAVSLKEFLDKNYMEYVTADMIVGSRWAKHSKRKTNVVIALEDLGLFFWERGGKQFAQMVLEHEKTTKGKMNDLSFVISEAEFYASGDYEEDTGNTINSKIVLNARDFLDALACLGEEKVKELIKEWNDYE